MKNVRKGVKYATESVTGLAPDAEYIDRGEICHCGEVVDALLRKLRLEEHVVNSRIREAWPSLVGTHLAVRSYPDSLRKGVLTVRVTDSATNHHICALKTEILRRLQEMAGDAIKEIKCCF